MNSALQKVHKSRCAFSGFGGAIKYIGGKKLSHRENSIMDDLKNEYLQKIHRNECAFFAFELAVTYMRG
ncbi:MAG: hypothetical protein ACI4JN_06190 [Ruminococcus sp.]